MRVMEVLVDDAGDAHAMVSEPPPDGSGGPIRRGINPDVPAPLAQVLHQRAGPEAKRLVIYDEAQIPGRAGSLGTYG